MSFSNNFKVFSNKSFNGLYIFAFLLSIEYFITYIYFINKTSLYFKFLLPVVLIFIVFYILKLREGFCLIKRYNLDLIKYINKGNNFLYAGITLFLGVFLAELLLFDSNLSDNSFFAFMLSSWLIIFNRIDDKYYFEREWVLLLFFFLFCTFTVFQGSYRFLLYKNLLSDSVIGNDFLVNKFLAVPTSSLLQLLGYNVFSDGINLSYEDLTAKRFSSVSVATGCSGIYSVLIFICLYSSYVLMLPISKQDFLLLLLVGIFCSYMANIFRMSLIILAGHYYGYEALEFAHANLGWIIFSIWIFVFWKLLEFIYPINRYNLEDY